jgi:hypothetical protein
LLILWLEWGEGPLKLVEDFRGLLIELGVIVV